ncbi:Alpha/Beta hydrolase protein [Boeremia exigua]|uniref:Alpha/Beta hydrolase protein n=1 Tax=Boeremia exigua TaxID=749465 RepID=UPI001E8D2576|nr:Alpha/Beta hydrolase protein [Boeremia exigua]KAH6637686.1 Alpha/Beta hydrolase protein [Boeremia exigua]
MASIWTLLLFLGTSVLAPVTAAEHDKPALILVPGAFHSASVYGEVISQLSDVGYIHNDAVDLPSVGYAAADVERKADVEVVTELLRYRLRKGEDVIMVGNSYGATVIMEAVKDFEAYSSTFVLERTGVEGRILGLIMLSGYIPTIAEVTANPPRPDIRNIGAPFFKYHDPFNTTPSLVTWDRDLATYPPHLTFYNLLNASAADHWTSQLLPSSFKALNATGTYIAYDGTFRTVYVIGEYDNSVSPAFARTYIDQEGAYFEVVVIDGDHVPMLSRPKTVVDVIRRFAEA